MAQRFLQLTLQSSSLQVLRASFLASRRKLFQARNAIQFNVDLDWQNFSPIDDVEGAAERKNKWVENDNITHRWCVNWTHVDKVGRAQVNDECGSDIYLHAQVQRWQALRPEGLFKTLKW